MKGEKLKFYLQFLYEFFQIAFAGFLGKDFEHLLADVSDLAGLGVASRLHGLVCLLLREGNSEYSEVIAVGCAHVDIGLNKCLPLANQ